MANIRVLELASVLAGPLAGTALAERGAQVTKVECPPHGDVTRSWRSANESRDIPQSAYYEAANGHKDVIWKNLKTPEGRKWLEKALAEHDVLLENFKLSDLEEFGLAPESLAQRHPHLIHVRLIGFVSAPDRLAYDVVVQAETGFMHMNGDADGPPTRMPVALMDVLASHQIRAAVLEGLYSRTQGRKGYFATVSLEASGITALANQATNWLINGTSPERQGSAHPNIAPYGDLLSCTDGYVVLAVGNDRQFDALCRILQCPEVSKNEKFTQNGLRVRNRLELMEALRNATKNWSKEALELALREGGVPAGVVRTIPEVFSKKSCPPDVLITNASGAQRSAVTAYRVQFYES